MANARTQREMHHLGIDPDVHIGAPQGKQLQGRVVPPVPTRISSAPKEHPANVTQHERESGKISHRAQVHLPDFPSYNGVIRCRKHWQMTPICNFTDAKITLSIWRG